MTLFLSNRDTKSTERMDDPGCDLSELENTYRQFSTINSLISQWYRIYKNEIRPLLDTNTSNAILDIGFGGGDIPIKLAQWAKGDGFDLHITAIDPDPRAVNYVQQLSYPSNISFWQCELSELKPKENKFDVVIANHLIHHLSKKELLKMLKRAKALSIRKVIFNDIQRSDWAYLFFNLLARPLFRSSFITEDGITSIKRSYTLKELRNTVPDKWQVTSVFPFRLILTFEHE
ncbi:methyltransferase domain-containing protein [Fodinibius saliphilus]|uniref:methyltransferase domain-containing protein n=1 Tax=Fodinibius saliphilus TaxID=1920650 RepID=UPI0011091ED4|nr:methyltransferase domain-containing protein [Fodinibius saliphilus]